LDARPESHIATFEKSFSYTHLVNFESDEYHTATSKSLKEDQELLKAGFEYVTERDGIKIYRKRK
jgi:hypothetical protein